MENRETSSLVSSSDPNMNILSLDIYASVQGITTLGDRIYVVKDGSKHIDVFTVTDFTPMDPLPVDIAYPCGLVACSNHNCLYSTDERYNDDTDEWTYYVFKITLTSAPIDKWVVMAMPVGLSVTKSHKLLVSARDIHPYVPDKLLEYTTQGMLLRVINLECSIEKLYHAVELDADIFVVCHAGTKQHRICVVDADGQIMRTYGGFPGSCVGQLNLPLNLALDQCGNIFVADRKNNRVQLLSAMLDYLEDVNLNAFNLNTPRRIHFDLLTSRLYITHRN